MIADCRGDQGAGDGRMNERRKLGGYVSFSGHGILRFYGQLSR